MERLRCFIELANAATGCIDEQMKWYNLADFGVVYGELQVKSPEGLCILSAAPAKQQATENGVPPVVWDELEHTAELHLDYNGDPVYLEVKDRARNVVFYRSYADQLY